MTKKEWFAKMKAERHVFYSYYEVAGNDERYKTLEEACKAAQGIRKIYRIDCLVDCDEATEITA